MQELVSTGSVENAHAYLRLYLGWKRWNRPEVPVLPFSGGWEDWGLEETTVFELIEDIIKDEERRKEFINSIKNAAPMQMRRD